MTSFSEDESRAILDLFQNGGIVLFKSHKVLDAAIALLSSDGYRIHEVNCNPITDEQAVPRAILEAFYNWSPPNVGLDGFNDYIYQIEFENTKGVIIVIRDFTGFHNQFPKYAFDILDIMADNYRTHLRFGDRLLTLVQSDDPQLDEKIGVIGGFQPTWNSSEGFR